MSPWCSPWTRPGAPSSPGSGDSSRRPPPAAGRLASQTALCSLGDSPEGLRNPSRTAVRVVLRAHACIPVAVGEHCGCRRSSMY
jgi:hypothetical protein